VIASPKQQVSNTSMSMQNPLLKSSIDSDGSKKLFNEANKD